MAPGKFRLTTCLVLPWLLATCSGQTLGDALQSIGDSTGELGCKPTPKSQGLIASLARQIMLDRFQDEERIRAEGQSGIVQTRNYHEGSANYYSSTHTSDAFCGIHDRSDTANILGMGEVIAVLNGVQFRTAHADFAMRRPSSASTDWHETEPIVPPPVPPSVLQQKTLEEQIQEMREYFRAFKNQDSTHRSYQDYFKPVLCYLEGAWLSNYSHVRDEDAYAQGSWFHLSDRAWAEAYLGVSDRSQNVPQLPSTIMGVNLETLLPIFAQWDYRILCYPLSNDLPTSHLKLIDDLPYSLPRGVSATELYSKRGARYQVEESEEEGFHKGFPLLDRLTSQIPGADNVPQYLRERDLLLDSSRNMADGRDVNLGFYNRVYRKDRDLMGSVKSYRGFSDTSLFVALTTQEQVAPLEVATCSHHKKCEELQQIRATWMVPLEIVYMSPLLSWNPFNISHRVGEDAENVLKGSNKGAKESSPANGTNDDFFYRTPVSFFSSSFPSDRSGADTVASSRFVLDRQGKVHEVAASGTRIVLPEIPEVGEVRLRYPIAPVHGEGNVIWKELNAWKDSVLNSIDKLVQSVAP